MGLLQQASKPLFDNLNSYKEQPDYKHKNPYDKFKSSTIQPGHRDIINISDMGKVKLVNDDGMVKAVNTPINKTIKTPNITKSEAKLKRA